MTSLEIMQVHRLELAKFPPSCIFWRLHRKLWEDSVALMKGLDPWLVGESKWRHWRRPRGKLQDSLQSNKASFLFCWTPGRRVIIINRLDLFARWHYLVPFSYDKNTNLRHQLTSLSRSIRSASLELFYYCLAWRSSLWTDCSDPWPEVVSICRQTSHGKCQGISVAVQVRVF